MSKMLVFGNDWGFHSRILRAVAPLEDAVFLSLRVLVRGHFGDRVWGFGCACWGFGMVTKLVESDEWLWDSGDLGISYY